MEMQKIFREEKRGRIVHMGIFSAQSPVLNLALNEVVFDI
jgi:hypothetical protein